MSDSDQYVAKKGLEGVVFDKTTISHVNPAEKSLYYRGYPVAELAANCSYEEVAYVLFHGELPNKEQLSSFSERERAARELSPQLLEVLQRFPATAHPMDAIRTVVSYLGMEPDFAGVETAESALEKGLLLLAKVPTAIAATQRLRRGEKVISPRPDLSLADNFFHMVFGEVPAAETVKAFDGSLILYAEHSFNASTFSARVIISTQSDLCGAITGAIAALKGNLHGGANEAVMLMLQEIGSPERAKTWLQEKLAAKEKIMGFGHRVYRYGDSRVETMSRFREQVAKQYGGQKWVDISEILQAEMISAKKIYPNLDFPAGPVYYLMGFDIDLFTPIFAMARMAGWVAHVAEQLSDNRLVRPLAEYVGPAPRSVPPLSDRD
ncbi:bifunctional 2-methylcitrate synthase/citrate synthase [Bythopirellula goksoeyrii]|uniref:Citrate synthase n=1 Tax=Bythopirellula goksoeyrii TaxID=1400387 RepID=A0A5B9Q944_9BACT|nr:bifunctional 2-methylcitrate synthase/citrate synthase [Bythopirellula goksoeyrii]QEG34095.1 Citrate synthase [Bythopirellula goksoeyrii]